MNATANLTKDEKAQLESMEGKLQHVRTAVQSVTEQFSPGLLLYGEGGTGKSFTVLNALKEYEKSYTHHNSRMTGRGLVDALQKNPTGIHLIEDAETLFNDPTASGVLRSACWSQSSAKPMERPITWTAHKTDIRFIFTGGIIIISNENLTDANSDVRAFKTRINVLKVNFSGEEIKVLMKKICFAGHKFGNMKLSPKECLEVRDYLIEHFDKLNRPLDIRLMISGFQDRLQYKYRETNMGWQQMLEGRIIQRVISYKGRTEQNAENKTLALTIRAMDLSTKETKKVLKERGMSQSAYYRTLKCS